MSSRSQKRQQLMGKLASSLVIAAPLLSVAGYAAIANESGASYEMASAQAEARGEAEARKPKGEAEAQKAKGEGEAEAQKAKGEAEAKGEGEAEAEGNKKDVTRPRGAKAYKGDRAELAAYGKQLYDDTSLSTNGLSCNSCHSDFQNYAETFEKAYPHSVAMGKDMFGIRKVTSEQMVQICMVAPMEAKPLAWDSRELAALSIYVEDLQKEYAKK